MKKSFGGSLLKKAYSRSSLSSTPWLVLKVLAFPGSVSGRPNVDNGSWNDTHLVQSQEAPCYHDKQMLLV
jgi:hypothetical protein